ncbi:hypothetical protein [Ensifer sp. Root127]|uniref:hypothetical protein n=1 Tax=Ensifer sp. Root127 TaxID=1736440 RepID=UPI00070F6E3D|nr:hypothetical protein [Ensifer sp. Root127]KQW72468.1 hypothetical protein ASD03_32505 [Ensifer sp. Root127]
MNNIVFVHGVATRSGEALDKETENRNALLKATVFGEDAKITSPCWGDLIPELRFDGASFRKSGVLSLGFSDQPAAPHDGSTILPAIAKQVSASSALDLLLSERIKKAKVDGEALSVEEVKLFAAIVDLVDADDRKSTDDPSALAPLFNAESDQHFVNEVYKLCNSPRSLSLVGTLKNAAMSIVDRAANLASRGVHSAVVDPINPTVARFLGDVFAYLKQGPVRDKVRATVSQAISVAWNERKGGKVILIGHSLGGVILYDLLSDLKAGGLPNGFRAAALVTVGSQPGLFQELGLFEFGGSLPAKTPIEGPEGTSFWLNAFDPIDVFGFRSNPMFSSAEDFSFNSITGLGSAHSAYFARPQFYARLRFRLTEAGVL